AAQDGLEPAASASPVAEAAAQAAGPIELAAQGESDVAEPAPVGAAVPEAGVAELQPAGMGVAQRTIGEYLHELLEFRSAGVLVLDESAVVEASPHEPDEYDRLFDSPPSASFEAPTAAAESPSVASFD